MWLYHIQVLYLIVKIIEISYFLNIIMYREMMNIPKTGTNPFSGIFRIRLKGFPVWSNYYPAFGGIN